MDVWLLSVEIEEFWQPRGGGGPPLPVAADAYAYLLNNVDIDLILIDVSTVVTSRQSFLLCRGPRGGSISCSDRVRYTAGNGDIMHDRTISVMHPFTRVSICKLVIN